ncbi:MAG: Wzt carbohydrate-binding domain-containing protein [Candidatus Omnitrophica bacterium]|nr:Wzt carbohydrate-binding domain-containing protein [Candidatus Omnitrophota bacterium]
MTTCPINAAVKIDQRISHQAVVIKGLSKQYPLARRTGKREGGLEDFWALKDIDFDVTAGEIIGVIGRNGAGKTTLLNIIAGVLSPTSGQVGANGRILGLFNLGVGFQDELTGRENVFLNGAILGASRRDLENKLGSIIGFSELGNFIDMPLGTYSQGMRLRLGFSILVNLDFDILVIDEVLAVGDALFQSKCFERLMDFKRAGKTLVIVTQSMDLIERLCDRAALLDHGRLLFCGNPVEGIHKYQSLLNTEKFFVGRHSKETGLVENTKKWAEDASHWGRDLGTKEVIIEKVEMLDRFGLRCARIKSGKRLKIKVSFRVKNEIKDPHFGIAIFRNDGVYCYGPNTRFDKHEIFELKPGSGFFALDLHKLLLATGEYRLSIAVWDKNETLAFNYRDGYYKFSVVGDQNPHRELLNMPFSGPSMDGNGTMKARIDLDSLMDYWNKKIENDFVSVESVKLLNGNGEEKDAFMTNEPVKLAIQLRDDAALSKDSLFWAGIYRDDGVYCQGIVHELRDNKIAAIKFPAMRLLPGGYRISFGVWDTVQRKFILCHHGVCLFRMVFDKEDHGTIYMEHAWRYQLPKEEKLK